MYEAGINSEAGLKANLLRASTLGEINSEHTRYLFAISIL